LFGASRDSSRRIDEPSAAMLLWDKWQATDVFTGKAAAVSHAHAQSQIKFAVFLIASESYPIDIEMGVVGSGLWLRHKGKGQIDTSFMAKGRSDTIIADLP
jgi:hypothetical protein